MITIYNVDDTSGHSNEYEAALQLRDMIAAEWGMVQDSRADHIQIIPAAKCLGTHTTRDIDLLVFCNLGWDYKIDAPREAGSGIEPVYFRNLCLTFEVKLHRPEQVEFEGSNVLVRYSDGIKSATDQSFNQTVSLRQYMKANGISPPWITGLIWLRNCPESVLPAIQHNIIGGDATWETVLRRVLTNLGPRRAGGRWEVSATNAERFASIARASDIFTRKLIPSNLDRRRMEEVSKRILRGQQYGEKFGEQLLIVRGRGGTGKTVYLLKLAHDLYRDRGARVLILTYNKALVADIKRILKFMGITDRIEIRTVHSFMLRLLGQKGLKVLPVPCRDFLEEARYAAYKKEALELLAIASAADTEVVISQSKDDLDWDYVFVDESQDWPIDERDILFSFYDPHRFVLADGIDQLIRTHKHINWRESESVRKHQIITLHKSLRLKANICGFVKTFARHIGMGDLDIEPNLDVHGGRVLIIEGKYAGDRDLHTRLMEKNRSDNNFPVDMLFCVPPQLVDRGPGGRRSKVGDTFKKWGYAVWDGVDDVVRESCPNDLEQLRIVQYDSCRGLEGWIVVNYALDLFYDHKAAYYEPTPEEAEETYFDRAAAASEFALRWLMIPLTRAIDTLVIQVTSKNHLVTEKLRAAAGECGDTVKWHTVR
ncbi:MAG: AAA family ATPase [Acidobacteria bacterium]|nr:AAA family ATPase [Acidobacteriota bacterium]